MSDFVGKYRSTARGGLGRELLSDPIRTMEQLATMNAPIVKGRAGLVPIWFVKEPELASHVLREDTETYRRNILVNHLFKVLTGENLFTASGQGWAWRRRALSPAFRAGPLNHATPLMVEAIQRDVGSWPRNEPFDVQPRTMHLALGAASAGLFGVSLPPEEMALLRGSMDAMITWVDHRMSRSSAAPAFIPTKPNTQMKRAKSQLETLVREIIEKRKASPDGSSDLLAHLLNATDPETGLGLTADELVRETIVLLFAGHETTAGAAAWVLEMVARHADVQARAHEEVDVVLSGRSPTTEDLTQLKYVRAVVDETLRLYPPAWGTPRMPYKPARLGPAKIARFSPLIVATAAMHRDPDLFEEPNEFRPQRFLDSDSPPRGYQPFGIGPRQCIGARFALNELVATVSIVLRDNYVKPASGLPATPDAAFGLRAKNCVLVLTPR